MQILLSRSPAGPGRTGKQEQEQISPNHVQAFFRALYTYCDQRLHESRFQSLFFGQQSFSTRHIYRQATLDLTYQILLVLQPRLVVDLGILDPRAAAAAVAAAASDAVLPAAVGPVARRGPVGAAAAAVLLHGGFLLLLPEGHPADRQVPS